MTRFLFCLNASRFSTDGFFLSLLRAECFSFIAVSRSLFTKGFFFFIVLIIFEGMNFDTIERNVSFHADRAESISELSTIFQSALARALFSPRTSAFS